MSQKLEIWVSHIKDTHISHEHLQDISLHMGEIKKEKVQGLGMEKFEAKAWSIFPPFSSIICLRI